MGPPVGTVVASIYRMPAGHASRPSFTTDAGCVYVFSQLWYARPAASGTVLQVITIEGSPPEYTGSPHIQTTKSQAKSASTQVLRLGNPKSA